MHPATHDLTLCTEIFESWTGLNSTQDWVNFITNETLSQKIVNINSKNQSMINGYLSVFEVRYEIIDIIKRCIFNLVDYVARDWKDICQKYQQVIILTPLTWGCENKFKPYLGGLANSNTSMVQILDSST